MSDIKTCNRCGVSKPATEFHLDKSCKIGRHGSCKICRNSAARRWREENPEKYREAQRKHYWNHKEKRLENFQKWVAANPDRNRERVRVYRENNRDKIREKERRYRERNRDKVNRKEQRRRAIKRANGGSFTDDEWLSLCNKYGNRCLCCGSRRRKLTVDHIVPVTMGGTGDISNIQPLCRSCNSRKSATVIDYRT